MSEVPPGYEVVRAGGATAVALHAAAPAVAAALETHGSLHAWAARQPERREFRGRAAAYGVPLGDASVVVRHSQHGGVLAPITRDLFRPPTRAPRELAVSERLRALGVRTPEVVAYVRYPAPLGFERADVATRMIEGGLDLAAVIRPLPLHRAPTGAWVRATGALLHALAAAGALHPDLNLKNVLLVPAEAPAAAPALVEGAELATNALDDRPVIADAPTDGTAYDAWVLDVDVMEVDATPPDGGRRWALNERNLARLQRSLEKWRRTKALPIADLELSVLATIARHGPDAPISLVWRPGHNVGPT